MQKIYLETSKGDFFKALIQDHEMLSFFFFIYLQITGWKGGWQGRFLTWSSLWYALFSSIHT